MIYFDSKSSYFMKSPNPKSYEFVDQTHENDQTKYVDLAPTQPMQPGPPNSTQVSI